MLATLEAGREAILARFSERRDERREVSEPPHEESEGMSIGRSFFLENRGDRAMHCSKATVMTKAAMPEEGRSQLELTDKHHN